MMKKALLASTLLFSVNAHAVLPTNVEKGIKAAYAMQDDFLWRAAIEKAEKDYGAENVAILVSEIRGKTQDVSLNTQGTASSGSEKVAESAAKKEGDVNGYDVLSFYKGWKGSVEAGIAMKSGNTDREDINGALRLERNSANWFQKVKASAVSVHENDKRTDEEYRVGGEVGHNLSEWDYTYGNAEYIADKFSSYDWRLEEVIGYGRYFIKKDTMSLEGRLGVGGRHVKSVQGKRNDEFIAKPEIIFDWKINERLTFSQNFNSTIGSDLTISESTTGLKTSITDGFSLRTQFKAEHASKVDSGKDKLDTTTSLNLVYEF